MPAPVLVTGNYNGELAQDAVDVKYADHDVAVVFDRPYISNPRNSNNNFMN